MSKSGFATVANLFSKAKGPATQPRKPLIERSMRGRRKALRRIRKEQGIEAAEAARQELYAQLKARDVSLAA